MNVIQVVLMHYVTWKLMSLVKETVEFQRYSTVISANSSMDAEEIKDLYQVKQGQEHRSLAPWPLLAHLCHIAVLMSTWREHLPLATHRHCSFLSATSPASISRRWLFLRKRVRDRETKGCLLGLEGKCSGLKFWTDERFGHGWLPSMQLLLWPLPYILASLPSPSKPTSLFSSLGWEFMALIFKILVGLFFRERPGLWWNHRRASLGRSIRSCHNTFSFFPPKRETLPEHKRHWESCLLGEFNYHH